MIEKIYIKTTETCQLNCKHCYIGNARKQKEFFDEDKTIDWIKKYFNDFNIDEKEILFSFHGGEPFLCPLYKMQKVVNAFPLASFDATTNLCYILTEKILKFICTNFYDELIFKKSFIKTSWDHMIRFRNIDEMNLWENNVRTLLENEVEVKVIVCLTNILLSDINPSELIEKFSNLGVKYLDFERLTKNTTSDISLIPDYDKQDEWLLEFYNINNSLNIDMFDELKGAVKGEFKGCRMRKCMSNVLTINANGTIGGCPNIALINSFTDINNNPINITNNCIRKELIDIEDTRIQECYFCDLFQICNGDCHQLSWQDNKCPSPKKLIRRIKYDMERKTKTFISN